DQNHEHQDVIGFHGTSPPWRARCRAAESEKKRGSIARSRRSANSIRDSIRPLSELLLAGVPSVRYSPRPLATFLPSFTLQGSASMPGFKVHITASTALGVAYGPGAFLNYDVPLPACVLAGGLCSVSGMLPDLDSGPGTPLRESVAFAAAV